jgi:hypothetical protein
MAGRRHANKEFKPATIRMQEDAYRLLTEFEYESGISKGLL